MYFHAELQASNMSVSELKMLIRDILNHANIRANSFTFNREEQEVSNVLMSVLEVMTLSSINATRHQQFV